jgi:hypothetical protein
MKVTFNTYSLIRPVDFTRLRAVPSDGGSGMQVQARTASTEISHGSQVRQCTELGVAAPVLKLQRARIKTRAFSYFGKFKTF